jgi:hypothetical protein
MAELRALFERGAAAPRLELTVRNDGMVQSGPDPISAEVAPELLCDAPRNQEKVCRRLSFPTVRIVSAMTLVVGCVHTPQDGEENFTKLSPRKRTSNPGVNRRTAFDTKRTFVEFSITFDGRTLAYGASGQSPRCERPLAEYVTSSEGLLRFTRRVIKRRFATLAN